MKLDPRDPRSLRRHPLHKAHVPAPDKNSAEWAAFADSIHAEGRVLTPLVITKDGFVMDGWWRREAAADFQFAEVPCAVEPAEAAPLFLVESLTARKQMTRGAAVYLALGALSEYAAAANARASRNGVAGRTTKEKRIDPKALGSTPHPSSHYLAERWGCDHKTVLQAHLVRSIFHDRAAFEGWCKAENGLHLSAQHSARRDPATAQAQLRDQMEPLLFNGEKSLWSILQAAAGRLTTEEGKPASEQLLLFTDAFGKLIGRLSIWQKLVGADRLKAAKAVTQFIEQAPDDLTDVIKRALREKEQA